MFEETASAVKTSHRKVQQNQALTLTGHLLWAAAQWKPCELSQLAAPEAAEEGTVTREGGDAWHQPSSCLGFELGSG